MKNWGRLYNTSVVIILIIIVVFAFSTMILKPKMKDPYRNYETIVLSNGEKINIQDIGGVTDIGFIYGEIIVDGEERRVFSKDAEFINSVLIKERRLDPKIDDRISQ